MNFNNPNLYISNIVSLYHAEKARPILSKWRGSARGSPAYTPGHTVCMKQARGTATAGERRPSAGAAADLWFACKAFALARLFVPRSRPSASGDLFNNGS